MSTRLIPAQPGCHLLTLFYFDFEVMERAPILAWEFVDDAEDSIWPVRILTPNRSVLIGSIVSKTSASDRENHRAIEMPDGAIGSYIGGSFEYWPTRSSYYAAVSEAQRIARPKAKRKSA